jgi:hypothetical protein
VTIAALASPVWAWGILKGGSKGRAQVKVEIDRKAAKTPISPWIYGLGDYRSEGRTEKHFWTLRPRIVRWGGNVAERYNPKNGSWNTGSDWYFMNVSSSVKPLVENMIADNRKHGAATAVTIPMLGWVAKDEKSVSYPTNKFPAQQQVEGKAGNGMDKAGNPLKADPADTSVPFTAEDAREWVKSLKVKLGEGPRFYIVGNEPMLWNSTHRDVHPEPATYEEVASKYIATAKAIREADQDGVIVGPALWGWLATERSAMDAPGPYNGNRKNTDRAAHGDKPFLKWFLEQVVAEETRYGKSLIDAIDVHYYPENQLVRDRGKAATDKARQARIESTRSLWDPSYKDDSWINDRLRFIPRLHDYAAIKPNLGVCIGEYNFYGEHDIGGAIALAEVIGIFARERVACAEYWTYPPERSPTAAAFRLMTNYDGQGSGLGSLLLKNNVEIAEDDSVLTTWEPGTKELKILLINKSVNVTKSFTLPDLGGDAAAGYKVWTLASDRPSEIVESTHDRKTGATVLTRPMSFKLVVIPGVEI